MYEVILIVQTVIIGLLLVSQAYMFNQVRQPKIPTEEHKITYTGVPVTLIEDEMVIVSAQDGVEKDTEVAIIRVVVRDTNKVYTYVHNKEKDCYVRIPEVGAIMPIKGTTIKEVIYPLDMTSYRN